MKAIFYILALLCLVAIAHAQDYITSNGGSIGTRNAPRQRVQPSPTPALPQTVADAQQEAIRQHPDLGVQGSAFNKEFVARYRRYQQERPGYLSDALWPMRLADEIAADGMFKGAREQHEKEIAKSETVYGRVLSVVPSEGVLLSGTMVNHYEPGWICFLRGYAPANVSDGDFVPATKVLPDGTYRYTNALGAEAMVHAYRVVPAGP